MIPAPLPLRLGAALAMAAITLLLSLLPGVPLEGDTQFQWHLGAVPPALQNVMHLVFYALLYGAWAWALEDTRVAPFRLAAAVFAFGLLIELAQLQVPGRYASLLDGVLNGAGVALGYLACRARRAAH
ncbi:VanZ family protein [Pseudohaliea sp.]|uniref:VanZ family protein n=1 Tax=Pseudohaliea sp. TaxID=2740289 RepID=UPI0032EB4AE1